MKSIEQYVHTQSAERRSIKTDKTEYAAGWDY